jgi:hypothetical protein
MHSEPFDGAEYSVTFLTCIQEVSGSSLSRDTEYLTVIRLWVFSATPGNCRGGVLQQS